MGYKSIAAVQNAACHGRRAQPFGALVAVTASAVTATLIFEDGNSSLGAATRTNAVALKSACSTWRSCFTCIARSCCLGILVLMHHAERVFCANPLGVDGSGNKADCGTDRYDDRQIAHGI